MEIFGVKDIAVYPESRLRDDLGLITNCDSSPYDTLFQFLIDDFGWGWVLEEEERELLTVHDLVDYFCVHYSEDGLAIGQLRLF